MLSLRSSGTKMNKVWMTIVLHAPTMFFRQMKRTSLMCIIHDNIVYKCARKKERVFCKGWRQRWTAVPVCQFRRLLHVHLFPFRPSGAYINMFESKIMLVGNILTAAAYFALTAQLLIFAKRFQVLIL